MSPRISNYYIPTTCVAGNRDELTTIQNKLSEFIDNIMDGRSLSDAIAKLNSDNSVWTAEDKAIITTGKQVCGIILAHYVETGGIPDLPELLEFTYENGLDIKVDNSYCDDLLEDFLRAVNETLPESSEENKINYSALLGQVNQFLDEDVTAFNTQSLLDALPTNDDTPNNRRYNSDDRPTKRRLVVLDTSDTDSNKSAKNRSNSLSSIDTLDNNIL